MSLQLFLTGTVTIEAEGRSVITERHLRGKQGRLVFTYLVAERPRSVPREELAEALWESDPPASWEVGLSALISRIRNVVATNLIPEYEIVIGGGPGRYSMQLPTEAWIDIEAGYSAIDRAESALRNAQYDRILGPATVALTIARRPFLSGLDGHWIESTRGKLSRQKVRALDCISHMQLNANEPVLAIETAMEAIGTDPYRESSYRLLMKAYAASGNRPNGINAYHDLRTRLAEDLGTSPSPETEALYVKLLE